jgi:hypothetical protein
MTAWEVAQMAEGRSNTELYYRNLLDGSHMIKKKVNINKRAYLR